jgi:hypothetical protein
MTPSVRAGKFASREFHSDIFSEADGEYVFIFLLSNDVSTHLFKEELMKRIHKKKNFLMMLLLALTLIACGSDDDDGDDTPERQEDTTGSNGTTGSSGTSGTTGSPTTSCMNSRQRENIRLFLNRTSDLRTFQGSGTETTRADDGTNTQNPITAIIDYQQSGENTWIVNAGICTVAAPPSCQNRQTVITFKNGCLNVNGARAKIISTSDSSLTYSYFDARTVRDQASIGTGKLIFNVTERRNGSTVYRLNVKED